MEKNNPNITPVDGLVEGDVLELLLNPTTLGTPATLSALVLSVKNGGTTTSYTLADFESVVVSGEEDIPNGTYLSKKIVVGPKINQFQFVASGTVVATDLAYVEAEPKPIS
jgi:hypothetical protein